MIPTLSYQAPKMSTLTSDSFKETSNDIIYIDRMADSSQSPPFNSLTGRTDLGPSLKLTEDPMMIEDDPLVIDLTPRDDTSPPSGPSSMQGEDWNHRASAMRDELPCQQIGKNGTASMPSLLQSATSCSDSETGSQDSAPNKPEVVTGTFRFSLPKNGLATPTQPRAKREFVPEYKKDESYWNKRLKNNQSARLSRYKRKAMQSMLEQTVIKLQKENVELKRELEVLKEMFADQLSEETFSGRSGSPVSSPSSGLTASSSSLSSGGSTDRSSSSSPTVNTDDNKSVKTPLLLTDKQTANTEEENDEADNKVHMKETVEQQSHFTFPPQVGTATFPPPPAHSNKALYSSSLPPAPSYRPFGEVAPPAAHSSYYDSMPYSMPMMPMMNYHAVQNWHNACVNREVPVFNNMPSAAANGFPHAYMHEERHPQNYALSGTGSVTSPGATTVSEDDSNISSDLRKSISSDEESQQKMRCVPLKCRFKNSRDVSFL